MLHHSDEFRIRSKGLIDLFEGKGDLKSRWLSIAKGYCDTLVSEDIYSDHRLADSIGSFLTGEKAILSHLGDKGVDVSLQFKLMEEYTIPLAQYIISQYRDHIGIP